MYKYLQHEAYKHLYSPLCNTDMIYQMTQHVLLLFSIPIL